MINLCWKKIKFASTLGAVSVLLFISALPLAAQEKEGSRKPGRGGPAAEYSVSWMPEALVQGQEADLAMIRQSFSFSTPVAPLPRGVIGLDANVRLLTLDSSAVFPEDGAEVPGRATVMRLGVYHTQVASNGWMTRVSAGILSGSEGPLETDRIIGFSANAFLRIPSGDRNAWRFAAFYMPTESGLPFPVPLAAYEWRASETLGFELGIPLGIEWKPRPRAILKAAYVPLADIEARAELGIAETPATLLLGFEMKDEIYWIEDVDDDMERARFGKAAVSTGLRLDVSRSGWIRIGTSYQFNRVLGLGEGDADDERIEAEDGFTVEAGVGVRF